MSTEEHDEREQVVEDTLEDVELDEQGAETVRGGAATVPVQPVKTGWDLKSSDKV